MFFAEFTPEAILELKFITTLGVIIVGWELSAYFIYQYFRLKDERIQLNRVLLSYGILFGAGFLCLLLLNFNTLYHPNPQFAILLTKIAYWSVLTGAFFFWLTTYVEQFSELLNRKIHLFLILKSLIPIVALFFFTPNSPYFAPALGLVFLDGIFLLVLQVQIIKYSVATVKKRFKLIFLAEFLVMGAILMGAERVAESFNYSVELLDSLYLIGLMIMFGGEIIVFLAIMNFPSIYEFKWREVLLKLLIINQNNNKAFYSYDFFNKVGKNIDDKNYTKEEMDHLFSGGIIGIDSITAAITHSGSEKIKKIKHGNSYIILDYGSPVEKLDLTYALVVKEDVESVKFFLNTVKSQFEAFYKDILMNLENIKGSEDIFFGSFDIILKNMI